MKTIGFIDYYISEWHANNYPQWIAEASDEFCVKYAWAEMNISPTDGKSTNQWCDEFGVLKCETIKELCEKADYIIVLAPSNPEKHLEYAKEVLKYKKHTYIDKTFAPDYATALEIFKTADNYGTKFFSTSALRYATELSKIHGCKKAEITFSGSDFEEYVVHAVEMAVCLFKDEPQSVKVDNQGSRRICSVGFSGDKSATIIYSENIPYSVTAELENGENVYYEIKSDFFKGLISDILNFFETGEYSFDTRETLNAMKIRQALCRGEKNPGVAYNL